MAYDNENLLNEIISKVNIVEVISNYMTLTKKGKNHFGICPFHNDSNPSMSVSEDKQIYRCFVCGAGGNAFNFVSNYEKIPFMQAVSKLGESVGVSVNYRHKAEVNKLDNNDYKAYELITKFYENNLNSKENTDAHEYLIKRNINGDLIKTFRIGVSRSNYDLATKLLVSKGYESSNLIELGITNKNDYGFNDVFINRIMFPLFDLDGYVVGYSGRIYNTDSNAKYINTKETHLFKKGELLYNYHNAKKVALRENSVIIVEGFMDVIRLYSIGIENVVATMGTQVTNTQLDLMKSLSNNIILCMDGDDAGQKAMYKIGNDLINIGIKPKIIKLEKKLDPDEYIKEYGKLIFSTKLKSPISFTDFTLEFFKLGIDMNSYDGILEYLDKVIPEISKLDDAIIYIILDKLSKEFNIPLSSLESKIKNQIVTIEVNSNNPIVEEKKINGSKKRFDAASKILINYMLNDRRAFIIYQDSETLMPSEIYRQLVMEIIYFYKKYGKIEFAEFIVYLKNEKLRNLAVEIYEMPYSEENMEEIINDCLLVIEQYNKEEKIKVLTKKMKQEYDIFKKKEILEEIAILKGSDEYV